jgi:hypothetical protein
MKYLLTFVVPKGAMDAVSEEEMRAGMEHWTAFDDEAEAAGALIACEPLEDSDATTTVRLRPDGDRVVTDGPFAESKEQLGGFCLLECDNLDEALEWARKVPLRGGAIEIHPVMDLSRFGYRSRTLTPARAR